MLLTTPARRVFVFLACSTAAACANGAGDDPSSSELTLAPVDKGPTTTIPAQPKQDAGASSNPLPTACPEPAACADGTDLGISPGDSLGDTKSATGSTSQWLRVRLTESSGEFVGAPMSVQATLTPPAGANFDLFLYVPQTDIVECTAFAASSTNPTGATDVANYAWGETGFVSNGQTDDRWVVIEVRYISGPCDPSATWSLQVTGGAG